MTFKEKYDSLMEMVNLFLEKSFTAREGLESTIYESMNYSVAAGGKRLRASWPWQRRNCWEWIASGVVLPYAAALEMIHTYSLIHDDLPAMDNDDYRRGNPLTTRCSGKPWRSWPGTRC